MGEWNKEYNQANTLERGHSLKTVSDWCRLLCSIKVNVGPKACKLEEAR